MRNIIRSVTQTALLFIGEYVTPGCTVVDATCGNGHDTAAMAKMGAEKIYAFDIQKAAIENTRSTLIKENISLENIELIQDSHANMRNYINEKVQVIVFNLGYLPSADKEITTTKTSTLDAIKEGLILLSEGGLLCVTMYSGHPGGQEEKDAVLEFASGLDERIWHVAYINMKNQRNNPPEILLITLKRGV